MSFLSACISSETTTTLNNPQGLKVEFDPQIAAETRLKLALLYLENKQMQLAKENLDQAKQYQPNNAKVFHIFAYYYQQVNEDENAETYYKKSISVDADNGDTYHNYGTFLCAQARYKEADELFLKAISLPHYNRVADTYTNAALCAQENKNYYKAIDYGEHALSHNPKNIDLNLFLAALNITVKKYDAAMSYLINFQRISEPTAESLWQWVRLSYFDGNKSSLSKHGQQLLELFPDTPQAINYVNKKYDD